VTFLDPGAAPLAVALAAIANVTPHTSENLRTAPPNTMLISLRVAVRTMQSV
jgi:hypothetical protein